MKKKSIVTLHGLVKPCYTNPTKETLIAIDEDVPPCGFNICLKNTIFKPGTIVKITIEKARERERT